MKSNIEQHLMSNCKEETAKLDKNNAHQTQWRSASLSNLRNMLLVASLCWFQIGINALLSIFSVPKSSVIKYHIQTLNL